MVNVEVILYHDDDTVEVVESKEFPTAENMLDDSVCDWVYETVIKYDIKYNFADWENAPNYAIRYIDALNVVCIESMTDYVLSL